MTADNTPNMQYRITAFGLGAILVTSAIVFIFGNTAGHSALAGTFPGANGKIAFVSDRDGNLEIYTMDSDGSNQKRLTNNAAADDFPSWSPDGSKIAFASSRDGNNEIYVMNADGTNQVRLTNDAASDTEPTWSPEGTRIAFVRDNLDLYVMNSDSTNIVGLTTSFVDFYEANTPSWSPDGKTIAFACYDETVRRSDMANLCFIAPDGSNFMHILPDCTDNGDWDPSWSPDSSKIAFTSRNRDTICSNDGSGWGNEILVLNLETMGWTDILEEDHDFYGPDFEQPSWSPDGAQIAFACVFACVPGEGVYVMNSDGSNMHKLAADAAASPRPDWGLATTTSTVSECDNPTIVGTDGADVIDGTSRVDVIDAKGGDDVINGLGGNDIICGGSGNDTINGGAGSDTIFGGHGNDKINGGTGSDVINAGAGNDSLSGNGGNDKLFGSSGNDALNSKDGAVNNDTLDGGSGTDICTSNPDTEASCEF